VYGVGFAVAGWWDRGILRLATPNQCFSHTPYSLLLAMLLCGWGGEGGEGGEGRDT